MFEKILDFIRATRRVARHAGTTQFPGFFLPAAILAFAVCGCGGGDDDEAAPAPPAAAVPAPAPDPIDPVPAAAADSEQPQAGEEGEETEPSAEESAAGVPLPETIPPLDRWNDPFAVSLKDLIGGQTAIAAVNVLADELAKTLDELTAAANALNPESDSFADEIPTLNAAQIRIRHLFETMRFVGSLLPEEERNTAFTAARDKFAQKSGQVGSILHAKNLLRAAGEIGKLAFELDRPYVDPADEIKSLLPEKPAGNSSSSDYSYDSSYGGSSYGGSGNGGLEKACTDFLAAYTPGGSADAKIESHLTRLITSGQANLLGYNARGGSGSSDGYYGSDSYSSSYSSGSSSSPASARSTTNRSGGLDFGESKTPGAGAAGGTGRETIKNELRRSVAYALKDLLRDRGAKAAPKALIAYCAFALEDIVPEAYSFFKELPEGTLKDLDCYNALVIEEDYGRDPRVQLLLCDMRKIGMGSSTLETKMYDIYSRAPGTARFFSGNLAGQTGDPEALQATLTILNKIGDGDSAVVVAGLISSKDVPSSWYGAIIEILGNTGDGTDDGKVAQTLTRFLASDEYRERAKNALIRIGSPVEKSVAAALRNEKRFMAEAEKSALEILGRVGGWNSLRILSSRLVFYTEAKTVGELARSETAPPAVQIEPDLRNGMLKRTIESGAAIISRLQGTESPNFHGKSTGSSGSGGSSSDYGSSSGSDGYYDSAYSGSSSRSRVDPDAPRELFAAAGGTGVAGGAGINRVDPGNPGNAPLVWAKALAASCTTQADELARILGRAVDYESGKLAGERAAAHTWIERYYALGRAQIILHCQSDLTASQKEEIGVPLGRIESRLEKVASEKKRIQKSPRTSDGLRDGLKAAAPVAEDAERSPDLF